MTDAETEAPILWLPDAKGQLTGKDPDAGKDWGQKKKGARWLDGTTDAMGMNLGKVWEMIKDREACHAAVHWVAKSQTWLSDWTELNWDIKSWFDGQELTVIISPASSPMISIDVYFLKKLI